MSFMTHFKKKGQNMSPFSVFVESLYNDLWQKTLGYLPEG